MPTPTPEPPPSRRMPLKSAMAAAVAGALVLLPLGEVLREQGSELESLRAERALLDPLAHALAAQRSLLGHREVAERVLRGRLGLEPERRLRQGQVDGDLVALHRTLAAGYWVKALTESSDLTYDWRELARRVSLRQISSSDSSQAHQLLVEQAVQVMDLVSAAAPAGSLAQLVALKVPAQAQQAEALHAAIDAQQARLSERQARMEAQRAATLSALGALAVLAVLAALQATARQRRGAPDDGPPPGNDRGMRLGHGRRSTDTAPTDGAAQQLLDRLRAHQGHSTAEPPPPGPPKR